MSLYKDGRGWAELHVRSKSQEVVRDSRSGYKDRQRYWETPDTLSVFDSDWNHSLAVLHRAGGFHTRSHAAGKYATGGHNWYMTTRFDVWFTHPHDGWYWHGWLITGGLNVTFRVRKTKNSILLAPNNILRQTSPIFKHRFRDPNIVRDEADCFRIDDGGETKWFARLFEEGWHFGLSIGELFASRILRQAA